MLELNPPLSVTKLYHLPPVGTGTNLIESLTSYITRLAENHRVTVRDLLFNEITPVLGKTYLLKESGGSGSRFFNYAKALNGVGQGAIDFSYALQMLTGQKGLLDTTLSYWRDVIPDRGLLKSSKSWCPHCLEEGKSNDGLYEPLIWSLTPVLFCSTHSVPLSCKCPHCFTTNNSLQRSSRNGYCANCHKWIGVTDDGERCRGNISEQQMWNIRQLSELLRNRNIADKQKPTREGLFASFKQIVTEEFGGNVQKWSEAMQIPKVTAWGYYNSKNLPPLDTLLKCSYLFNRSLVSIIHGVPEYTSIEPELPREQIILDNLRPYTRLHKIHDIDALRIKLNSLICSEQLISVNDAARQLFCSKKLLYKYFPQETRALAQKYKGYLAAGRTSRLQANNEQIRALTHRLRIQGKAPTARRIEEVLGKPGLLKEKNLQKTWRTAKNEISLF
jgi:hypothetical protein